uniref:Uncharacterized protein n=1 Tax=Glossina brevipalpis TaxID=37001 RepID=A0A1A9WQS0_9MUSC
MNRVIRAAKHKNIPIRNDNNLIDMPTRELAVQIKNHLTAAAKYTNTKVAKIFGGLSVEKQERLLNKRPEIEHCRKFFFLPLGESEYLREMHDNLKNPGKTENGQFKDLGEISKEMVLLAPLNDKYRRAKVIKF